MGVVQSVRLSSTAPGDGNGSNAAVVALFLIALIVILVILLYGFLWGHWFTFGGTVNVVTSPGSGGALPSHSASAMPSPSP